MHMPMHTQLLVSPKKLAKVLAPVTKVSDLSWWQVRAGQLTDLPLLIIPPFLLEKAGG